jgi:hypothetical protein
MSGFAVKAGPRSIPRLAAIADNEGRDLGETLVDRAWSARHRAMATALFIDERRPPRQVLAQGPSGAHRHFPIAPPRCAMRHAERRPSSATPPASLRLLTRIKAGPAPHGL